MKKRPILNQIQASPFGDRIISFMYDTEEDFRKEFSVSKSDYAKISYAYCNIAKGNALKFLNLVDGYMRNHGKSFWIYPPREGRELDGR